MTRSEALEAVAEAHACAECGHHHSPEYGGICIGCPCAERARLDATPAPATSTPPTPTDEELDALWTDTLNDAFDEDEPGAFEIAVAASKRALYNAGRAACVARLRERATNIRKSGLTVSFGNPHPANVLENAADALESER